MTAAHRQMASGAGLLLFGLLLLLGAATSPPPLSVIPAIAGGLAILGAIGQFGDRR